MRGAALLLVIAAVAVPAAPAAAADGRPPTVPALMSWRATAGGLALRPGGRVIAQHRNRGALLPEARTLAGDLGLRVTARRRPAARPGEVVLKLDRGDAELGDEGYRLQVGRTVTITAGTPAGVFYGGRTLVQLQRSGPIPRGGGHDAPRYGQRGLMVDNGRQFFTPAWLRARIRELSDLKLNLLHLHFSDNQGFRLRSERHPEVVTEPALSHADIRALVAYARTRHVTIVPELDLPGHLEAALRAHPELQLRDVSGARQPDKLDVTLPEARAFIGDLLDEFLPLFDGPWWHTGADEYLGVFATEAEYARYPQLEAWARERHGPQANGKDAVLDFVNWVGARVRAAGKGLRVWSDGVGGGSAVTLDRGAVVEWWENRASPRPADLAADGHGVVNAGWWPTYFVTGGPLAGLRAPEDEFYEQWEPWRFDGPYTSRWAGIPGRPFVLPPDSPRLLGAKVNVWNDEPGAMSEEEIAAGVTPRLRILAQKTWGSRGLTDRYADWVRRTAPALG